jgi:hypothetical protein
MKKIKIALPHTDNYVLVHVCEDKCEFNRRAQTKDGYGVCIGCRVENYKRSKKVIKCEAALVYLIKDQVGAGYVSHELTHAVLYLLRYHIKKIMLMAAWWKDGKCPDTEEYICDAMGTVQQKFWNWWYRNYDLTKGKGAT